MDRKLLIELFQSGMKYSAGKHQFWITRRFDIKVCPNKVVEMDEYEGFDSDVETAEGKRMFHVGRSILHLKNGHVVEHPGKGWKQGPP